MESCRKPEVIRQIEFYQFAGGRFLDINVYQCGWERCAPRHTYGPAVRRHYLFHYVINGKGQLETNGETYEIQAGQGFLLFPKQLSTYTADVKEPWEYTWLEFDGLRVLECVTRAGLDRETCVYVPADAEAGAKVRDTLLYVVEHTEESYLRIAGRAMIFLDQLEVSSSRRAPARTRLFRDFYLDKAVSYIEEHYRHNITIEGIASACGLNRSYFGRIFKEGMGESPQQFLIRYRMTRASELLKNSRMPIRDVSAAVGYENQLHFSRAFKAVFGVPPREYRQQYDRGELST